MKITSEYIWEKNQRDINEDSLCLCHVQYNGHPLIMAAVCDGVGTIDDSDKASSLVITNLKNHFFNYPRHSSLSLRKLFFSISRCVHASHREISSGATTICLCIIYRRKCYLLSCGDSRIYYGYKRFRLMTYDHKDSHGRLTMALGDKSFAGLFKTHFRLRRNSFLLLCSDGFYKFNHNYLIQSNCFWDCKDDSSLKDTLLKLYYSAVNRGERDNSSAIIIHFE